MIPPIKLSAFLLPVNVVAAPVLVTVYPIVPVAAVRDTLLPLLDKLAVPALLVAAVAVNAVATIALRVAFELTTRLSPFDKSVMLSVPASIVKVSLPAPPVKVSLPAPPVKVSLPVPPVKLSALLLPTKVVAAPVLVTV